MIGYVEMIEVCTGLRGIRERQLPFTIGVFVLTLQGQSELCTGKTTRWGRSLAREPSDP